MRTKLRASPFGGTYRPGRRGERRVHLRSEGRRLRAVLDTLPVGVWVADSEGRIIESNRMARKLWGLPPARPVCARFEGWRAETGDPLETEEWPLRKALRTGESVPPQEMFILRFDRRCRTILNAAAPIRGNRGKLIGAVAVDQDITARRRAEDQIRSLADFPRENPHPNLRLGPGGQVLFANDRAAALMKEEQALKSELLPSELLATAEEALRTGDAREVQVECAARRIFSFHCAPIAGRGYVNLYGRDVTEMVRMEQALRENSALAERRSAELEATLESIAAPLVIYDTQGAIVRMNAAAEKLLAYTSEMRAKPMAERSKWLRIETPDGVPLPTEKSPVGRALRGEVVANEILVFHFPHTFRASVTAAPIRSPEGRTLGAVATLVDITALHDLQREREMVLHTVSHDLRTPLTVILGHAQLMAALPRVGEDQIHLDAILTGAKQMDRMIEDLVETARLESGEIKLEAVPVRLDQFFAAFLQRSAPVLDTSRIVTDVPELPPVTADPSRLERILTNLLSNALKYSPPDTVVKVRARQDGQSLVVSVHDHGIGIDPEDLPHVFERFYRFKSGKKAGSVGLGLYITRALVEAHGGQVCIESAPGVGSEFFFTLPLHSP